MANDTLNIYFLPLFKSGQWKMTKMQMKESVAMPAGSAVYTDQAGEVTVCTASTQNFVGILMETIASTDADYATAKKLKTVAVPLTQAAEAEFDVLAGTFTTADVGKVVKFSTHLGLAVDTAGTDGAAHAQITRYLNSGRGVCKFLLEIGAYDVA
jgi:hypothetical protein